MDKISLCLISSFIIAYYIGNFCGAIIISKYCMKKDIRELGSSNPGTTNMSRVFGIKYGIITFFIDFLKAFLVVKIVDFLISVNISESWGNIAGYLVGIAVILGHNYPIIFKFKGGKGFASVIGIYMACDPLITCVLLVSCLIILLVTDIMSVYAMTFFTTTMLYTCFITEVHWSMKLCTVVYFFMGIWAHRNNIKSLLKGTERKLGIKSKIFN